MKKIFACAMILALCIGTLAGCGSKSSSSAPATEEMKDGQTVETVVNKIEEDVGIAMAADLEENVLKDIYYVDKADTEAYYGRMSMANVNSDSVVAVKAKSEKKDAIKQSLEKRLTDVQKSFEQYLPDQYEKAMKGRVIEKGNYVFLLIIGESSETYDADMQKAVDIINAAF